MPAHPPAALLSWVDAELNGPVEVVRGLRDGGTPWLLRAGDRDVVLRTGRGADRESMTVEHEAAVLASAHGVPVAGVLAARLDDDEPAIVVEAVAGASTIPVDAPVDRLRALGAWAARLHAIAPPAHLPPRDRPIAGVDFDALRAAAEPQPLLVAGERAVREHRPDDPVGFVHGDLWQGNALWVADDLLALIDWDCAGHGPAGVDLGSLRCDAAVCFGVPAAEHVLAGWQEQAGRAADHVAYWDVVAALSTPPDLGWFVGAMAGQGRADLTREILRERRDAYLAAALDRL